MKNDEAIKNLENMKWLKGYDNTIIGDKPLTDIIDGIITLLKEQEAVEPNPVHNSFRWFACGKCDCSITREDRFCPRCGRAVKWKC